MANKIFTISIVVLVLVAVGLGYLIYRHKSGNTSDVLFERRFPADAPNTQARVGDEKKEFRLVLGENAQLFGIAAENPYYGEPPATKTFGQVEITKSFEIWGDVVSVDLNDNTIIISTDYPRPINTDFTPRGPRVSLQDIKVGDRIVASSEYDESGEPDYNNIQFIQITPSVEEIKRLQEKQNQ